MDNPKDLTRLGVFTTVVNAGGISRAAAELGLSKSAISKQLAALEDSLGLRLLQRTPRHFSLTAEGQAIFEHSQKWLGDYGQIRDLAAELKAEPSGTVVVDIPTSLLKHFVLPRLSSFLAANPGLNLDLRAKESGVRQLTEGSDIAVIIDKLADSSAKARLLGKIMSSPCASPRYLRKHGTPSTPKDLVDHNCLVIPYINMPGANQWVFYRRGRRSVVKVQGNLMVNDPDLIQGMILAAEGIALQPWFASEELVKKGRLVRLLEDYTMPEIPLYLTYLERKNIAPKLRVTIDFMVDCFKAM